MSYPTYTDEAPQSAPRSRRRRAGLAAGAAIVAVGATISLALSGGIAAASFADPVPTLTPTPEQTGGHKDPANVTTCADAGLTGSILLSGDTGDDADGNGNIATVSADKKSVTVTIVAGFTVSGIVVKGGPGYNVYNGPFVGPAVIPDLAPPPDAGINGNIPTISHYFVCGDGQSTQTTGTTTDPTDPCATTDTDVVKAVADTCSPTDPGTTPGTTTTGGLPKTGQALTGVLLAGATLVIAGGATLFVLRRRRSAAE